MNPSPSVLAKAAGVLAAAIPLSTVAKQLSSPSATQIGEMWGDQFRLHRFQKQLGCVKKAQKMAKDAGFSPRAVPIKILFPLLDGAALEDDNDIQTMWASLLANAANPATHDQVRPSYLAILKQMAPDEAALLNWIYRKSLQRYKSGYRPPSGGCFRVDIERFFAETFADNSEPSSKLSVCLSSLEAFSLVELFAIESDGKVISLAGLTDRGRAFADACVAPAEKKTVKAI